MKVLDIYKTDILSKKIKEAGCKSHIMVYSITDTPTNNPNRQSIWIRLTKGTISIDFHLFRAKIKEVGLNRTKIEEMD